MPAASKASPTPTASALASRPRVEGPDVVGQGAGEPDFDAPQHIKDGAAAAMEAAPPAWLAYMPGTSKRSATGSGKVADADRPG